MIRKLTKFKKIFILLIFTALLNTPLESSAESNTIVYGKVYDQETKNPIQGVEISSNPENTAISNENGEYKIEILPKEFIHFRKDKYVKLYVPAETVNKEKNLDVYLNKGVLIQGRILDYSTGNPIKYAMITFMPSTIKKDIFHIFTVNSNEKGEIASPEYLYASTVVINGEPTEIAYNIHIKAHGYADFKLYDVKFGGEKYVLDNILMTKGFTVSGNILTEEGKPFKNEKSQYDFELKDKKDNMISRPGIEIEGNNFKLPFISNGNYILTVQSPGFKSASRDIEINNNDIKDINIVLEKTTSVIFKVINKKNKIPILRYDCNLLHFDTSANNFFINRDGKIKDFVFLKNKYVYDKEAIGYFNNIEPGKYRLYIKKFSNNKITNFKDILTDIITITDNDKKKDINLLIELEENNSHTKVMEIINNKIALLEKKSRKNLFTAIFGIIKKPFQTNKKSEAVIIEAILSNQAEKLNKLLEKNIDLNFNDNEGLTPLIYASCIGNLDIVKSLIEKKADLNTKDNDGLTALSHAIFEENINIIEFLISSGADINLKDNNGISPIIYAVKTENMDIINTLLNNNADIDFEDYNFPNLLHNATDNFKILNEISKFHSYKKFGYFAKLKEEIRLIEFNIGFVKILTQLTYENNSEWKQYAKLRHWGIDMYETTDFYDLKYSDNLILKNNVEFETVNWKGTTYQHAKMDFSIKNDKTYESINNVWVSYNLKRFPYFKTQEVPAPNKTYNFSTNYGPSDYLDKKIVILAFPPNSQITQISSIQPFEKKIINDWSFLLYDLSNNKNRIVSNVQFALPSESSISLDPGIIDLLLKDTKE